jgi:hypothetical protein
MKQFLLVIGICFLPSFLKAQLYNLCGVWYSYEYICTNPTHYELFSINQMGDSVVCTKIIGDSCVTDGHISWEGIYDSSQFTILLYSGSPGAPNSGSSFNPLLVIDSMHLFVAQYINMYRYTDLQLDSLNIQLSDYGLDCNRNMGQINLTVSNNFIFLYPNPVETQLTIDLTTTPISLWATLRVYDVQGRKIVLPTTFTNTRAQLNTTSLVDGFYTVKITNSKTGESKEGKFVK